MLITDVHTAEVQFRSSYPGKCSYLPKAISPAPNFLNLKIVIMYNKITLLLNSERQTVRQIDRQRQREEEGESDVMSSSISVQVFETGSLHWTWNSLIGHRTPKTWLSQPHPCWSYRYTHQAWLTWVLWIRVHCLPSKHVIRRATFSAPDLTLLYKGAQSHAQRLDIYVLFLRFYNSFKHRTLLLQDRIPHFFDIFGWYYSSPYSTHEEVSLRDGNS